MLLIVDDELDIQTLGTCIVRRNFDFPVMQAGSVSEAKKVLQEVIPTIALLDIHLPDGNGFELVPLLKRINPAIQFAFISAFNLCQEIQKAKEIGAHRILGKPFKTDELTQLIKEMCDKVKDGKAENSSH